MHRTYNQAYLTLFFLAIIHSLEIPSEPSASIKRVGPKIDNKLRQLIEETVSENNILRERLNELEFSHMKMENKIKENARFDIFAGDWEAMYLELKDQCEEEKTKIMASDDKINRQKMKESLLQGEQWILEREEKMRVFEARAKDSEYKLKQCLKGNVSMENKDNGLKPNPTDKILNEVNYILKDFQINEDHEKSSEEKSASQLLKLVKERLNQISLGEDNQNPTGTGLN